MPQHLRGQLRTFLARGSSGADRQIWFGEVVGDGCDLIRDKNPQ